MRWGAFLKKVFTEHIWRLSRAGLLGCAGAIALSGNSAIAQNSIIPDTTLGAETSSVVSQDESFGTDVINGGAIRGVNLFHSFQEFNVAALRRAYFINPDNSIQNILARVTGNNRSEILGTLGISNAPGITSRANLFLMNPNGIIFGSNARLDISGSFVATTANAIAFPGGAEFSVTSGVAPDNQLLRVNPSAFLFNQIAAAPIQNNSIAPAGKAPSGLDVFGLRVPDGQNLLLVGGNININRGGLNAFGGRVELGGLAGAGTVELNGDGSLSFPNSAVRANVSLTNLASVDVRAGGGGFITINAKNLEVSESLLAAGINPGVRALGTQAGDIKIDATEKMRIEGTTNYSSEITNTAGDVSQFSPNIKTQGSAGNVIVNTGIFEGIGSVLIGSGTNAEGNAGSVTIVAKDKVSLTNPGSFPTAISSVVGPSGVGKSGGIFIKTRSLSLSNVILVSSTAGQGDAGNIQINISDSVVSSGSQLQAVSFGRGNAGNIVIEAENAAVSLNRSLLNTFVGEGKTLGTVGTGNGGDILIKARALSATNRTEFITTTFSRTEASQSANAGNIQVIVSEDISLTEGSTFGAETLGLGNAGDIKLIARNLSLSNMAFLSTSTGGKGKAGMIRINASDTVSIDGSAGISGITSIVLEEGEGDASDIEVYAKNLALTNNAALTVSTIGKGNAGNIKINVSDTVVLNGKSGVFSTVQPGAEGNAGKIELSTQNLSLTNDAFLNTLTFSKGNGGIIRINASDTISLNRGSVVSDVATGAEGNAGEIEINTGNLAIINESAVSSTTLGKGNAGIIRINAKDSISLNGIGGISSSLQPEAEGKAGDIELNARNLYLTNGALIDIRTIGTGNAGTVNINVRDTLYANNGNIRTDSRQSSGGAISINARDIRLFGNSDISTFVFSGAGGGGNITLTADSIIAFNDSDILAFASDGKGGDITFKTPAFFGDRYEPASPGTDPFNLDGNNRVDINASGRLADGSITIPDVSFLQNSLTELPQTPIDTNALIANSCIARSSSKQENTFTITGSGGLPNRPGDASISSYSTGDVRDVQGDSALRSWHKGDPIVEPSGVYRLPSGKLILSRECS